jgi:hypothetical protein
MAWMRAARDVSCMINHQPLSLLMPLHFLQFFDYISTVLQQQVEDAEKVKLTTNTSTLPSPL